ncbi:MAG: DUF1629 domain-containing protein [Pseudomonadota bacterium]
MVWLLQGYVEASGLEVDRDFHFGSQEARNKGRAFRSSDQDVEESWVPRNFRLVDGYSLPPLLCAPYWLCDGKTRDVVEVIEPGVHEFYHRTVTDMPDSTEVTDRYVMRVRNLALTVDPTRSDQPPVKVHRHRDNPAKTMVKSSFLYENHRQNRAQPKIAQYPDIPANIHLWREKTYQSYEQIYCSDEMMTALQEADCIDPTHIIAVRLEPLKTSSTTNVLRLLKTNLGIGKP